MGEDERKLLSDLKQALLKEKEAYELKKVWAKACDNANHQYELARSAIDVATAEVQMAQSHLKKFLTSEAPTQESN